MGEGDEYNVGRNIFPWRRSKVLWIILGVATVALFLVYFPSCAVKRAHDEWLDCTNHLYETGQGEASDCPHRALVAFPKIVPWTRKKAKALAARMDYDEAENALKIAAVRKLDAAARDRAANQLVDAIHEHADHAFTASSRLMAAGAMKTLVDRAADLDPDERREALRAAARLGDRAALERIAKLTEDTPKEKNTDAALGISRCLLGDTAGGIAALDSANAAYRAITDADDKTIQFAKAACDPKQTVEVDEMYAQQLAFLRVVAGGPPSDLPGEYINSDARPAAAILAHLQNVETTVDDFLRVTYPSNRDILGPTRDLFSPWNLLAMPGDWAQTPAWDDDTASQLANLAEMAKPPKPKKKTDPYDDLLDEDNTHIKSEARMRPAAYLRYSALLMELEAAYGWARRGEDAKARASVTRALSLAQMQDVKNVTGGDAPLFVVGTLELVGEWATAEALLQDALAHDYEPDVEASLRIELALAQAHDGKLKEADDTLTPALTLQVDAHLVTELEWLRVAFRMLLGKPVDVTLPSTPEKLPVFGEADRALAYWVTAASAAAPQQAFARWKAYNENIGTYDVQGVMPAAYVVMAKAAGAGDVELWLDDVTDQSTDDPQAIAAARAEAARWRGDKAAAAIWDQRLAAFRHLATDDRTEYLLQLLFDH